MNLEEAFDSEDPQAILEAADGAIIFAVEDHGENFDFVRYSDEPEDEELGAILATRMFESVISAAAQ